MYSEIGASALALSWLVALMGIGVSGWLITRRVRVDARWNSAISIMVYLNFMLLLLAALALWAALLNQQYQLRFVWETTAPATPHHLRISALWGGQRGSLLFWSLLMSGFMALGRFIHRRRQPALLLPAMMVALAVVAFFNGITLWQENPFSQFWLTEEYYASGSLQDFVLRPAQALAGNESMSETLAASARGGSSLLRHPAMLIHPPLLYLGFVGMVMPFAFAMAALIRGDGQGRWLALARPWLLIAWLFLGAGLLLGGRWAYDVLGWGGYWGWDPVENAAFLPWLAATALLHSLLLQEKRGIFKTWNFLLVTLAFSSVLFATFATRSGLVESVHSFARSEIGWPLFFFWAGMTLFAGSLIARRHQRGELRSDWQISHWSSREFLFALNNLLFTVLIFAIFWGSFGASIVSELLLGQTRILRVAYFERVTVPLFIAIFFLMGVAPLAAWGARNGRRVWRQGRPFLLPVLAACLALYLFGARRPGSYLAISAMLLAGLVALREMTRPVPAAQRRQPFYAAIWSRWRRDHRRLGGYLVHFGVVVVGLGIAASSLFQQETQQTLRRGGDALQFGGYDLQYTGYEAAIATDGRQLDIAELSVSRAGEAVATLQPRLDYFPDATMTIAGVHRPLAHDLYVLLVPWQTAEAARSALQERATFKVYLNPLVGLVWWGGLLLVAGTLISGWGGHRRADPSRIKREQIAGREE